ncbi:MAG: hypothetical protein CVT72_04545 [Alphaproteobacteria bacterium HGW-Alphaproteobacteria-11]|nr:MAG: hypothetical protein CVT72_04545 [Alphaproteobacteria bacterium HGW-Alphaproteobacteria-11]
MTVLEQVQGFLTKRAPQAVCDDCIADRLALSVRQHANHKTRELAKYAEYERHKDKCGMCGNVKLVTRHT